MPLPRPATEGHAELLSVSELLSCERGLLSRVSLLAIAGGVDAGGMPHELQRTTGLLLL